jgi:hypothetical protein
MIVPLPTSQVSILCYCLHKHIQASIKTHLKATYTLAVFVGELTMTPTAVKTKASNGSTTLQ